MVDEYTNATEVEGTVVYVVHVDDSGAEPVRTALALLTKDDLELTVDESEEELELASERRTRRYRTHNTAELAVSSAFDVDMEVAQLMGITDADGKMTFGTETRRMRPEDDEYLEIAYFNEELDEANLTYADAELIHRFADVEVMNPEVNISETPPLLAWTWIIHGDIQLAYDYVPPA